MPGFNYLAHMATYNRQISDVTEFMNRLQQFTTVHNFIEEHNASGARFTVGHNQFSDWFHAEYKQLLGYAGHTEGAALRTPTIFEETNDDSPINWVEEGAVTPVKDQG